MPDVPTSGPNVRVGLVPIERFADCRALWLALRDHHGAVEPHLGPVRDDDESWTLADEKYGGALRREGSFLVLAEDEDPTVAADAPLGCALVAVDRSSTTWQELGPHGSLEVLSVAPQARGLGLGTRLLAAVQDELDRLGMGECRLLVTPGNLGAQAFYREAGFETFALVMRRPGGQDA